MLKKEIAIAMLIAVVDGFVEGMVAAAVHAMATEPVLTATVAAGYSPVIRCERHVASRQEAVTIP